MLKSCHKNAIRHLNDDIMTEPSDNGLIPQVNKANQLEIRALDLNVKLIICYVLELAT